MISSYLPRWGLLILLALGSVWTARAQVSPVPSLINFQGRLTLPGGGAVADGAYTVRISLWDAASGGTERWSQTLANVSVRQGQFSAPLNLSSGYLNGATQNSLFGAVGAWLEVKVGADPPMAPRQRLMSVPYAMKADRVADGSITAGSFAAGALNASAWLIGGNTATNPATHFLGTSDAQPLSLRTNNVERMRLDGVGRVFIGRPNAVGAGRLILSEDTSAYTGMYIDSGANGWPFYGYSQNGSSSTWTWLDGADGNKWKLFHSGDRLAVTQDGKVGIGTNAPEHALDVAGNIRSRGADFILNGRGGGIGNSGGAGRALVDDGPGITSGGGLYINFLNDYGKVTVDSPLNVFGDLTLLAGGFRFPDGSVQTTAAGGGSGWSLSGNAGTNPGTHFLGTTDNQPILLRSNNNRLLGLQYVQSTVSTETYTSGNVLGGYWLNNVSAGVTGATIAGGGHRYTIAAGSSDSVNRVTDMGGTVGGGSNNRVGSDDANLLNGRWATIGGGVNNVAGNRFATVGGGLNNTAAGVDATVAGGWLNSANNLDSTVSGGQGNIADGQGATIPGGTQNRAGGAYAFAAGNFADAAHAGSFVWGDFSSGSYISSSAVNEFNVRASGGARIFSNSLLTTGVVLAPGGGSWSSASDRTTKTAIQSVDPGEILDKLMRVPVSLWSYKSQGSGIRHIGPMAQDFFAEFGVGEDDRHITTIDADGVSLAGVQALYGKLKGQEIQLREQQARMGDQQKRIDALEQQLAAILAGKDTHEAK